jgi:ABC-type glycerol-3-phosphate transport system substrate-binding protein
MEQDGGEPPEFKRGRWPVTSLAMVVVVLMIIALAFGIWGAGRDQAAKRAEQLEAEVQNLLDVLHGAYLNGDGELFFANQAASPAWLSAQLQPENQLVYSSGPQVTRVERFGYDLWANIQWRQGDQTLQRVAFFQQRGDRLIQIPTVEGYWGPTQESAEAFGRLTWHEIDGEWRRKIASFIKQTADEICAADAEGTCPPERWPFDLVIASDFATTAQPNQIRVPSPRLVGLDADGRPSSLFWDRLRQALIGHLAAATIQFAVPEEFLTGYQNAAAAFSAERPDIQVEILALETLPQDPLAWPADIDGAAMTPDMRLITAGRVLDLTDYAASDPAFDQRDFYEQIWQGALWQERLWFLPQAANLRLLFYDRQAYQQANLAEPSLRWTWDEMAADLNRLAALVDAGAFEAVFLDPDRDALFSYAFNIDNDCGGQATIYCAQTLSQEAVGDALSWYRSLILDDRMTVDLAPLTTAERNHTVINLTSPRNTIIWSEHPVLFEHHLLYQSLGVVPFPGSERFDGITPLAVQGSFISSASQHPLATWEWLDFLSYQSLARQKRLVPARPSVAMANNYWVNLPRPVSEAMRAAFPFARPVLIEEAGYFPWPQLAALSTGQQTPDEVLQTMARVRWFGWDSQ